MLTIAESEDAEGTSILQATETKPGVKVVNSRLPDPRLHLIYRLEAAVGDPQDLGEISAGHRRIVPSTGGTFSGPELRGTLLPGASADWQIVLSDGTALGDVRYTLETQRGDLLYVQSVCATEVRTSSNVSGAGKTLTQLNTPSALQPRSRPEPPTLSG
jgi:hypothetical protein